MRKLFEKTDHEIELFSEDAAHMSEHFWSDEKHITKEDSEEIEKEWKNNRLKIVHSTFEKEYRSYVKKRKYFYGCPHELYLETFKERLSSHLSKHEDNTLITFIESEFKDGVLLFNRTYVSPEKMQKIQASLRRRYEFLVERAQESNHNIILLENDKVKIERILKNNLIDDEDLIEDISGEFTVKERIIALHCLGVLKFLYDNAEINSVNQVAKAVRSFTGFNYRTVQSFINPIFSQYADQSKSALDKISQVENVKKHLDNYVLKKNK